jgi:4-hydroxythreonine-4-phosphate dehydrogenase
VSVKGPIAVTMGDPSGIGPEITLRAWQKHLSGAAPRFFVIGDPVCYASPSVGMREITTPEEALNTGGDLPVLPLKLTTPARAGTPISANATAIIDSIKQAVTFALSDAVPAIVTNPIAKAVLYETGFGHQGHTDFLGALTEHAPYAHSRGPVMMLTAGNLRVALATEHIPHSKVPADLKTETIVRVARVVNDALRMDYGIAQPRLAIAALNPHAGESGKIGDEENRVIIPAAKILIDSGINVTGPLPADSLFHAEARAKADAVICMYHDQALIPVKMLDFWGGVNVTLGLPIVRTSPDHGTGFDIAGKGVARADSLIAALKTAEAIAARRATQ